MVLSDTGRMGGEASFAHNGSSPKCENANEFEKDGESSGLWIHSHHIQTI